MTYVYQMVMIVLKCLLKFEMRSRIYQTIVSLGVQQLKNMIYYVSDFLSLSLCFPLCVVIFLPAFLNFAEYFGMVAALIS